jgi:hypothetical protein
MDNGSIKKISKKKAKALVYDKFASALSEYKSGLKPKKFEAKLKKASKLFAADIVKATSKPNDSTKKTKKKATKPKRAANTQPIAKELLP